jgi:hypothetical protein
VLEVEAADETLALALARLGAGEYVTARVEGLANREIQQTMELQRKIGAMKQPRTLYTLGKPQWSDSASKWQIPFDVIVVDAAPRRKR